MVLSFIFTPGLCCPPDKTRCTSPAGTHRAQVSLQQGEGAMQERGGQGPAMGTEMRMHKERVKMAGGERTGTLPLKTTHLPSSTPQQVRANSTQFISRITLPFNKDCTSRQDLAACAGGENEQKLNLYESICTRNYSLHSYFLPLTAQAV